MRIKAITDHQIEIELNVSLEWEINDDHCCECDAYEIQKPVSASYAVDGGEPAYYYFGMTADNPIEEAILNAVSNGDITHG